MKTTMTTTMMLAVTALPPPPPPPPTPSPPATWGDLTPRQLAVRAALWLLAAMRAVSAAQRRMVEISADYDVCSDASEDALSAAVNAFNMAEFLTGYQEVAEGAK